jgi:putative membrane protein
MSESLSTEKKYNKWIVILSVVIPLVVAALFRVKLDIKLPVFLPPVYATINALTAVVLIIAVVMIKQGKVKIHERLMKFAILLSVLFLVMYVLYHMTSDSTSYEGNYRGLYLFILISHIVLSIGVIPFVLVTYVRAITNNIERHKKIAKITFPLWLYVAVTGVIVYLMISPFYTV